MKSSDSVWVVDDDRSIRWVLERAFDREGIATQSFDNAKSVLSRLDAEHPQAIVSDIRMPGIDGLELLERLQVECPEVPVIIMTAHSDLENAVQSYQSGAFEYLPKPFDVDEAVAVVKRAIAHAIEQQSESTSQEVKGPQEIIGQSPAMQEVFRAIGRLANSHITVLINGESGTGKELVAKALHRHSPRSQGNFIALNMAAIPRELIESELFGHERGSFTGASQRRIGRFEQADGGTLFLDEIGDMPADTQTRLLRVLENGEFYRVGGHSPLKVDVRIIAATHQDLEQLVAVGDFREDLFHRINVIRVHLPKLSERRNDIGLLARHFLNKAAEELGGDPKILRPDTEAYLTTLEWRGNVRQLENTCRWLTVMAPGHDIHIGDLPPELARGRSTADARVNWEASLEKWAEHELMHHQPGVSHPLLEDAVPRFERVMIAAALKHTGGRKRDAADLLGWGRNTLTRKLKELEFTSIPDGHRG